MPNVHDDVLVSAPRIRTGHDVIDADLTVPPNAHGIVVFAHGSGSSRRSSRNRAVAAKLQQAGFATLLADLLTHQEEVVDERTAEFRFDIELLARRVVDATDWIGHEPEIHGLPIGYFGASTGAAAALVAAARRADVARAVVSRGGRPDLAGAALPSVLAPTLLIVGGKDAEVIQLNRAAMSEMVAPTVLEIIPGATHLFPEPGALDQVTRLARDWFSKYLIPLAAPPRHPAGW